jgi:DNA-binding transcriptional regulator YiaG
MKAEEITKEIVAWIRYRLGMSQEDFGLLLRYKQPQVRVSEIETGFRAPSKRIQKICLRIMERL